MKRIFFTLVACVVLAVPLGAQSKRKITAMMDSWKGGTRQQLYQQWGPPTATTSDGGDGQILIYSKRHYTDYTLPPGYNQTTGIHYHEDYYTNKMMYVGADGVVYGWRYTTTPNLPDIVELQGNVDVNVKVR